MHYHTRLLHSKTRLIHCVCQSKKVYEKIRTIQIDAFSKRCLFCGGAALQMHVLLGASGRCARSPFNLRYPFSRRKRSPCFSFQLLVSQARAVSTECIPRFKEKRLQTELSQLSLDSNHEVCFVLREWRDASRSSKSNRRSPWHLRVENNVSVDVLPLAWVSKQKRRGLWTYGRKFIRMTDGLLGGVIQGSANWDYNFGQLFLLIKSAEPDSSSFSDWGSYIWAKKQKYLFLPSSDFLG